MALTSGSMKLTPFQAMTLLAAAAVLIPTTPVRYVTRFDPTPLFANLSTPAIAATSITTSSPINRLAHLERPALLLYFKFKLAL